MKRTTNEYMENEQTIQEPKKYPEMNDVEKKQMWDEIAYWLSMTEEERAERSLPRFQKEIYEMYQIPESTYYYQLQNEEFMKKVVRNGLTRAKRILPKLVKVLEKNIEEGKEKSMEMGFKYIAEVADKLDHTTNGKDMPTPIYGGQSVRSIPKHNSNQEDIQSDEED